jgi:hypothetical protein
LPSPVGGVYVHRRHADRHGIEDGEWYPNIRIPGGLYYLIKNGERESKL